MVGYKRTLTKFSTTNTFTHFANPDSKGKTFEFVDNSIINNFEPYYENFGNGLTPRPWNLLLSNNIVVCNSNSKVYLVTNNSKGIFFSFQNSQQALSPVGSNTSNNFKSLDINQ